MAWRKGARLLGIPTATLAWSKVPRKIFMKGWPLWGFKEKGLSTHFLGSSRLLEALSWHVNFKKAGSFL